MPRVEFVNLSLNRLGPIEVPPPCRMDSLKSLVLNNTKLEWESVESLLNLLPVLEELHLSLNEYTHVLLDTIELTSSDEEEECDKSDKKTSDSLCSCSSDTRERKNSYNRSMCIYIRVYF